MYKILANVYSEYSLELENISEYSYNSILKSFANFISLSYYQHIINVLYIFIIIAILYILYRDIIYRNANNIKRCKTLKNNIDTNMDYNYPFVYNIYIIKKTKLNNLLEDYSVLFTYDFINQKTDFKFGDYKNIEEIIISSKNIDYINTNNFLYFDLKYMEPKHLKLNKENDKNVDIYFDKARLTNDDYAYIVTTYDDKQLLAKDDKNVKILGKFIRDFGYDVYTPIAPIYDILYAVEYKKNK